jgi:hypothetical protein
MLVLQLAGDDAKRLTRDEERQRTAKLTRRQRPRPAVMVGDPGNGTPPRQQVDVVDEAQQSLACLDLRRLVGSSRDGHLDSEEKLVGGDLLHDRHGALHGGDDDPGLLFRDAVPTLRDLASKLVPYNGATGRARHAVTAALQPLDLVLAHPREVRDHDEAGSAQHDRLVSQHLVTVSTWPPRSIGIRMLRAWRIQPAHLQPKFLCSRLQHRVQPDTTLDAVPVWKPEQVIEVGVTQCETFRISGQKRCGATVGVSCRHAAAFTPTLRDHGLQSPGHLVNGRRLGCLRGF